MPGADRDLLVAGGGPSGLATAILAAQAGMRVTVIEPKPGIIDKACGEGLMPAAVAALGRLGLPPQGGHPFIGVRYFWGSCMAEGRFSRGQGLGLRRLDLHAALQARAHALGVETVQDRVGEVQQDADGVRAAGLRAPYLVAADGLRSPVRAALGLDLPPRRPARVGLRRHFRVPPRAPFVEVHWSPLAEAYITPVGPDRVGLAFLMRQGQGPSPQGGSVYDALLASFPELQDWLGDAPVDSAVAGAGPFERRVRAPRLGRVLLVGDAAGYLDPLTGEGLRLGFDAAEAAVTALLAGQPERYPRAWDRLARRYLWMTAGLLALSRPPLLRRALVPVLKRLPSVMGLAIGLLGEEPPRPGFAQTAPSTADN